MSAKIASQFFNVIKPRYNSVFSSNTTNFTVLWPLCAVKVNDDSSWEHINYIYPFPYHMNVQEWQEYKNTSPVQLVLGFLNIQ